MLITKKHTQWDCISKAKYLEKRWRENDLRIPVAPCWPEQGDQSKGLTNLSFFLSQNGKKLGIMSKILMMAFYEVYCDLNSYHIYRHDPGQRISRWNTWLDRYYFPVAPVGSEGDQHDRRWKKDGTLVACSQCGYPISADRFRLHRLRSNRTCPALDSQNTEGRTGFNPYGLFYFWGWEMGSCF